VATTKTGQNDASCVVWAIATCFYFIFFVYFDTKVIFYCISRLKSTKYVQGGRWNTAMTKTGPNDVFGPQVCVFFVYFDTKVMFYYISRL
jgi:hypothetical protein